jgi:hypothetical protein
MDMLEQAQRALEWFQRLAPRLRRLATILRVIAAIGVGAATLIFVMVIAEFWTPSLAILISALVVCVALGAAPLMLWIFAGGITALADLPDAIAASPDLFRQYAWELSDLYDKVVRPETKRSRSWGSGLVSGIRLSWRVWREFPDIGAVRGVAQVSLILFALAGLAMTIFNVALLPAVLGFDVVHS